MVSIRINRKDVEMFEEELQDFFNKVVNSIGSTEFDNFNNMNRDAKPIDLNHRYEFKDRLVTVQYGGDIVNISIGGEDSYKPLHVIDVTEMEDYVRTPHRSRWDYEEYPTPEKLTREMLHSVSENFGKVLKNDPELSRVLAAEALEKINDKLDEIIAETLDEDED